MVLRWASGLVIKRKDAPGTGLLHRVSSKDSPGTAGPAIAAQGQGTSDIFIIIAGLAVVFIKHGRLAQKPFLF